MSAASQTKKVKTLFLCSENSCRSQMAEGFLRELAGDKYEAYSAGLESSEVNPLAIEVMKEKGIDITNQKSKPVNVYLGKESFLNVIFVCEKAEKSCPTIYPAVPNTISWLLPDPAQIKGNNEEKLAAFRRTRDEIEILVREFIQS